MTDPLHNAVMNLSPKDATDPLHYDDDDVDDVDDEEDLSSLPNSKPPFQNISNLVSKLTKSLSEFKFKAPVNSSIIKTKSIEKKKPSLQ